MKPISKLGLWPWELESSLTVEDEEARIVDKREGFIIGYVGVGEVIYDPEICREWSGKGIRHDSGIVVDANHARE